MPEVCAGDLRRLHLDKEDIGSGS